MPQHGSLPHPHAAPASRARRHSAQHGRRGSATAPRLPCNAMAALASPVPRSPIPTARTRHQASKQAALDAQPSAALSSTAGLTASWPRLPHTQLDVANDHDDTCVVQETQYSNTHTPHSSRARRRHYDLSGQRDRLRQSTMAQLHLPPPPSPPTTLGTIRTTLTSPYLTAITPQSPQLSLPSSSSFRVTTAPCSGDEGHRTPHNSPLPVADLFMHFGHDVTEIETARPSRDDAAVQIFPTTTVPTEQRTDLG